MCVQHLEVFAALGTVVQTSLTLMCYEFVSRGYVCACRFTLVHIGFHVCVGSDSKLLSCMHEGMLQSFAHMQKYVKVKHLMSFCFVFVRAGVCLASFCQSLS